MDFDAFFGMATEGKAPSQWQRELAASGACTNRLIRIPTGLGKTLAVFTTWLWRRVHQEEDGWPRRLVWCLPMRVLVEQIEAEVEGCLDRLGVRWDGRGDHAGKVGVHVLMGGSDAGSWHLYPEETAVLIGTQDMLLSRAMNRGYASPRARWPMELGLLNQDCLWVMDEVQLMDVGLATSAQIQAFRHDDQQAGKAPRPARTWWMSATLQRDWLNRSPDTADIVADLPDTRIDPGGRTGPLWDDVTKRCSREQLTDPKAIAARVAELHREVGRGDKGPSLVVVNTVERAVRVATALRADKDLTAGTDIRLIHGRFRPLERALWHDAFLNRAACGPQTDRIIVSTQVIEAGVDLSAPLLVTELAPWPSLVQRFGRCARWGGEGRVVVADFDPKDDKAAAPYSKEALDAARHALQLLANERGGTADVAPLHLESFEEHHPDLLLDLYPYNPPHLLLRHELEELFDTTPDLSGSDIDISRFIRSGEERDLQVFWAEVAPGTDPPDDLQPTRESLCAVPFLKARDWLCGKESEKLKAPRLKPGMRAWVRDWLAGAWRAAARRDLFPGRTVLVAAACGGYESRIGWNPDTRVLDPELPLTIAVPESGESDAAAQDGEPLSGNPNWQGIAFHGAAVGRVARRIADRLVPDLAALFDLAGRWHDAGKAHLAFQGSIRQPKPAGALAKAPKPAWLPPKALYSMPDGRRRPGFRHELVSTLALLAVLERHRPEHEALLGPWRELLERTGMPVVPTAAERAAEPTPVEREVLALDDERFDLLAFLVCAHHGKVRLTWHACPADQEPPPVGPGAAAQGLRRIAPSIRGVQEGDELPIVALAAADGSHHDLPAVRLHLAAAAAGLNPRTGQGWTERALGLLARHGPFTLAWMEALLRAADQRASADVTLIDPQLVPLDAAEVQP